MAFVKSRPDSTKNNFQSFSMKFYQAVSHVCDISRLSYDDVEPKGFPPQVQTDEAF